MYAPDVQFQPEILIERTRQWPDPVRILVRTSQIVNAVDPVLEEVMATNHLMLDAAHGLGVPSARANELIVCKAGQKVTPGDILAGPVGLARRVVRAPKAGKVLDIGQGTIMLELDGGHRRLKAGIPGQIVEQIPETGVIIRAYGGLVQGIWGNGGIGEGELCLQFDSGNGPLTRLSQAHAIAGKILVGGYCQEADVLRTAEKMNAAGMLLGSMSPRLVSLALSIRTPVVLIDGFGSNPMNRIAYDILFAHGGSFAALNAESINWLAGTRPELVIPKMFTEKMSQPRYPSLLAPGRLVRIHHQLIPGQLGRLIDLLGDQVISSGIRAPSASVQLDSGEIVTLPIVNLELIADWTRDNDGN
jgi:hypothetical protein